MAFQISSTRLRLCVGLRLGKPQTKMIFIFHDFDMSLGAFVQSSILSVLVHHLEKLGPILA